MRYIAYYRTSTTRQNLGIEAQRESVHQFIQTEGASLIGEYQEKESGKNDHRPQLEAALRHCKKENATLLIAKLDRLSRKVSFIFALREAAIAFRALDLPEVNDVLTLSVFAGLAEKERTLISERTKRALAALREQGVRLGNPNGFTAEAQDKATATKRALAANNANNKQSKAAAQELRSQGFSIPDIVRYLSANGYKTSRGLEHNYMSVSRLLK